MTRIHDPKHHDAVTGELRSFPTMKRWAVTCVGSDGLRTLVYPNQGRNFKHTKEEAERWLAAFVGKHRKRLAHGRPETLEVRPVSCYLNGDAVGIYFD